MKAQFFTGLTVTVTADLCLLLKDTAVKVTLQLFFVPCSSAVLELMWLLRVNRSCQGGRGKPRLLSPTIQHMLSLNSSHFTHWCLVRIHLVSLFWFRVSARAWYTFSSLAQLAEVGQCAWLDEATRPSVSKSSVSVCDAAAKQSV